MGLHTITDCDSSVSVVVGAALGVVPEHPPKLAKTRDQPTFGLFRSPSVVLVMVLSYSVVGGVAFADRNAERNQKHCYKNGLFPS